MLPLIRSRCLLYALEPDAKKPLDQVRRGQTAWRWRVLVKAAVRLDYSRQDAMVRAYNAPWRISRLHFLVLVHFPPGDEQKDYSLRLSFARHM